jgi:hypothetical protein
MQNDLLQQLRELALKIHIEPKQGIGQAATVESVVTVLKNISASYEEFLFIELSKEDILQEKMKLEPGVARSIIENMKLRIVDVNFGSFEAAIAPQIVSSDVSLFSEDVQKFEKKAFSDYQELVAADLRSMGAISGFAKRYTPEERAKIFKPLFRSTGPDYRLNIKNKEDKVIRTLVKPGKEKMRFYVPNVKKDPAPDAPTRTVMAFVELGSADDKLTKSNISKIHHIAEIAPGTHPFVLEEMVYENFAVDFHDKIVSSVSIDEELFIINNEALDITAWGDTRIEAEEAFRFSLYAIYQNYYFESVDKLSPDAVKLRDYLFNITKSVTGHEA